MLRWPIGLVVIGMGVFLAPLMADETDWQEVREQIVRRGADYLVTTGSSESGAFSQSADPGVTALCTTALLRSGRTADDPVVQRSLKYLESFVQPDGGIYRKGSFYQNYETSIAMMAFHQANTDGRYDSILRDAARFTRQLQWDEDEGKDPSDPAYGGAGYGSHKRPDLSNTQFFIEALKSQESEENRAAIERALVFVSRSQNLESPHNTLPFAAKIQDGGFYYTPAAGGSSQAGTTENGGLRSYGSMTYAGLKSMIHAGLGPDDPRVQAALKWIQQNYTMDENPGMGDSGLFYYFHTFAKALDAIGKPELQDVKGEKHDWRRDLTLKLESIQQPDGSWVNRNERWLEGDPKLATAFALLALSHCQ